MGTNKALKRRRGFTLIELMVALGIIAILAVTVILVINPVNLLKEGRDSQRIADLAQMNRAMGLYIANGGTIPTAACPGPGANGSCFVAWPAGLLNNRGTAGLGTALRCGQRYNTSPLQNDQTVTSSVQMINGTGWVPVNVASTTIGTPISQWPLDPKTVVNLNSGSTSVLVDTSQYYSFACANSGWEFTANMESPRYSGSLTTPTYGVDMVEENDGGTSPILLEVGTDLAL